MGFLGFWVLFVLGFELKNSRANRVKGLVFLGFLGLYCLRASGFRLAVVRNYVYGGKV